MKELLLSKKSLLQIPLALLLIFIAYQQIEGAWYGSKEWLLLAASLMQKGRVLYVDIMETNPPLILWVYELPVILGNLTSWDSAKLLAVLTILLAAYSLYLCAILLARHPLLAESNSAYGLMLWLIAFIFILWPDHSYFSDREHFFMLLVLPYFIRHLPTISKVTLPPGVWLSITLMASLGFCLKPHLLVFLIVVQLFRLVEERSLRVFFALENWVIAASLVVYLSLIKWITPEYGAKVWPMLRATYNYYRYGAFSFYLYLPAFFTLLFATAGFKRDSETPLRKDLYYWLGLLGCGVIYAQINNGWPYTFYPLNCFAALTAGWLWIEYQWIMAQADSQPATRRHVKTGSQFCTIVIICNIVFRIIPYYSAVMFTPPVTTFDKLVADFEGIVTKEKSHGFGAISMHFGYWPRIVKATGSEFVTRYHSVWPMFKYILEDTDMRASNEWIAQNVAEGLADDLTRKKPDLVFVDTSPDFGNTGKSFDSVNYFESNALFKEAWTHYTLLTRISYCEDKTYLATPSRDGCQYDVFKRHE